MSRSGYVDDYCDDTWAHIRYRGAVSSAIRGSRGQKFLHDLIKALDEMPVKELHASKFQADGEFCTLGIAAHAKQIDLSDFDYDPNDVDHERLAATLGLAAAFVREVMYENDECVSDRRLVKTELAGPVRPYYPDYGHLVHSEYVADDTAPTRRWRYMREWAERHLNKESA